MTATDYRALWIPVVGPSSQLGSSNNASGDDQMFVLDGLAQAAGVTLLMLGLALPAHRPGAERPAVDVIRADAR